MIAIFVRGDNKFLSGFLFSAAIGVVVTTVFEIIRRPRAEKCCSVSIVRADGKNGSRLIKVSVQKKYAKTVRFFRALDSGADNGDYLSLSLSRGYVYPNNNDFGLEINIYKNDTEDELVKELFSLLKRRGGRSLCLCEINGSGEVLCSCKRGKARCGNNAGACRKNG